MSPWPLLAVTVATLAMPPLGFAQSVPNPDDPSVIAPDDLPPGATPDMPMPDMPLPDMPSPPGDQGPMVRPAPDQDPEAPPEAFGGPLTGDEQAAEEAPVADTRSEAQAPEGESEAERIDRLFAELKRTADQTEAQRIAGRIERSWRNSGSATVDLLMRRAAQAIGHKQGAVALDVLDQALVLDPDFTEAWNRRATAHFGLGDLGKSLADIEQVLAREPRHWGAMMGLALILERTGREAQALTAYQEVLNVYPALKSAQDAVGRLSEKLTGPEI
ncbi:MAG: tetratricopeptide repeat protein [Pseudomonadota bacterium]|nr:tetratricopeptide repeat protein [Pseudomonadota bacterium]